MPEETSASPGELSRFLQVINLFKVEALKQTMSAIDGLLTQDLPAEYREEILQSAAEELIDRQLKNQSLTPNLSDEEGRQEALSSAVEKAVAELEETNHPLLTLLPFALQEKLIETIKKQDPNRAEEAAQATHQAETIRTTQPTSSQVTAKAILEAEGDNFSVDEAKAISLLHHIRNQKEVINNPGPRSIDKVIDEIVANPQKHELEPAVAEQFCQKLKENTGTIQDYVLTATDPLPRQTPFTPWKPVLDNRTLRQARSLKVPPLALKYAKCGFFSNDPHLSPDLQKEIAQIHQALADPLNPQNKLGLGGTLTAYRLVPQVFLAQKLYRPIYETYQKTQAKANQFLEAPFQVYQAADKTYKNCRVAINKFKKTHPLGWLIAPRLRTRRAFRYLVFKSSKRRQLYRQAKKITSTTKTFWSKWGPKGMTKRVSLWAARKVGMALFKLGTKLSIKALQKLGEAVFSVGSGGIGAIILTLVKVSIGFAFNTAKKLWRKLKEEKEIFDQAGIAAKAFQAIFAGLKALGAFIGGAVGGLGGMAIGALVGGLIGSAIPALGTVLGAIVGGIVGFFFGGSIGSLLGWSWLSVAAVPVTASTLILGPSGILGGGMTGIPAANLASTTAGFATGGPLIATTILVKNQLDLIDNGFYLPPEIETGEQKAHCTDLKTPLPFPNSENSPIARRAWEIVSDLYQGFWCYWNRSPGDFPDDVILYPPSYPQFFDETRYLADPFPQDWREHPVNLFWCTRLVVQAFSETGHDLRDFTPCQKGQADCYCPEDKICYINLLNSQIMQNYFTRQNKFIANSPGVYQKISPGNVIFIKNTHPDAPKRTNHVGIVYSVNQDALITVESNNVIKTNTYTVAEDGSIQKLGEYFLVIGFGQP